MSRDHVHYSNGETGYLVDSDGIPDIRFAEDNPLYTYCTCGNQIRFGSESEDLDLCEANLSSLYAAVKSAAYRIPDRATIDGLRTSQAWMAASIFFLSDRLSTAAEWARFVDLDVEYAWVTNPINKMLAISTINLILSTVGADTARRACPVLESDSKLSCRTDNQVLRRLWFDPLVSGARVFDYEDRKALFKLALHPVSDATRRILAMVYLADLDMYAYKMDPGGSIFASEGGFVCPPV